MRWRARTKALAGARSAEGEAGFQGWRYCQRATAGTEITNAGFQQQLRHRETKKPALWAGFFLLQRAITFSQRLLLEPEQREQPERQPVPERQRGQRREPEHQRPGPEPVQGPARAPEQQP